MQTRSSKAKPKKMIEPPIASLIRYRNENASFVDRHTIEPLKMSILSVISHYARLPTGFMKEESIRLYQSEEEMVSCLYTLFIYIHI